MACPSEGSTDATGDHGLLSNLFYGLRRVFIPTSPALLLSSQKRIFETFVKVPVTHKQYRLRNGEFINYVEIDRGVQEPGAENKTLVLTHGYASGLGFFFGNSFFTCITECILFAIFIFGCY
jgi:hypothetical protein